MEIKAGDIVKAKCSGKIYRVLDPEGFIGHIPCVQLLSHYNYSSFPFPVKSLLPASKQEKARFILESLGGIDGI